MDMSPFVCMVLTLNIIIIVNAEELCAYQAWWPWSECSVSCGTGTKTREELCCGGAIGGSECVPLQTETENCYKSPVNGGWGEWSYTSCTKTCGSGSQSRTRLCNNPTPARCGSACSGSSSQTIQCNSNCCPVNGNWGLWGGWLSCSVTCGQGTRQRTRGCNNPVPSCGGSNCIGSSTDTKVCSIEPVNGGWGEWSKYTSCTKTCGSGSQSRTRVCNNPTPARCGSACSGSSSQTIQCNSNCCPVNGNWGLWGVWSSCSVTCGQGTRQRIRGCNNPVPSCGGSNCIGSSTDTNVCSIEPVNGGWGDWSKYTSCTKTCGGGSQSRTRVCNNPTPARCGSACSGSSSQTIQCNSNCCPVAGGWGQWGIWSQCSATCGHGMVHRERECNKPSTACGGSYCAGDSSESASCNIRPVHGEWGIWSKYDTCSKTCGNGTHTRIRECNDPAPINCGDVCFGNAIYTTVCSVGICPSEQVSTGAPFTTSEPLHTIGVETTFTTETIEPETNSSQDPHVTKVWPNYGPKAGGTTITVQGFHFTSRSVIVIAHNIFCETELINDRTMVGVTPGLTNIQTNQLDKKLLITIITDTSNLLNTEAYFTYKANPTITNVYPRETILKGGTHLTADGTHLDSVAMIEMETTMVLRELVVSTPLVYNFTITKYTTPCTVLNQSLMRCLTPALELPSDFIIDSFRLKREIQNTRVVKSLFHIRSKRQEQIQFSNDGDILEFSIGFNLDGIHEYKNYTSIDVFVEPKLHLDPTIYEYKIGERMTFKGNHLDVGVTTNDYNITIGSAICGQIDLLSNALSCYPPTVQPEMVDVNEYGYPRIMIRIGMNIELMAGYLRYPTNTLPLYVMIIAAVIPACIVLTIVVTVSVVCVKKRRANNTAPAKPCTETCM